MERLAEEVAARFPSARTIVMSSDLAGGVDRLRIELTAIAKGEVDIIIGTQLVAKGHNFPLLTLVGVVDGDLGLAFGDMRAAERTFQLLSQVTGRAGRFILMSALGTAAGVEIAYVTGYIRDSTRRLTVSDDPWDTSDREALEGVSHAWNAAKIGEYFLGRLRELQQRYTCIGHVRGKGLMLGAELVEDRASKVPAAKLCDRVITRAFHNGLLLLSCGQSTIRFMPPLLITQGDVDEAVRILGASLDEALSG